MCHKVPVPDWIGPYIRYGADYDTEFGVTTTHDETVRPEWVDYNGHMNVAYYVLVFDHGTDAFLDAVGLGAAYRHATDKSMFVVESHVTYQAETRVGDALRVETRVLGTEGKKVHLFHRMTANGKAETVATNEILLLHVDLASRRAAALPEDAAAKVRAHAAATAALAVPDEAGRAVSMVGR